ncbi:MAG: hypothetical protein A2X63_06140 [Ignavibacteria bacterium GWA2_35_8]|nr:MAG: hypothetical protein A2X63_06140 [Ignavibacteria bacterium GWA2_35_8]
MENKGEIIIYQTEDNETQIEVRLEEETIWLTQAQMMKLFETTKQNISLHINNIFKEGELQRNSVVKEYLTTAIDGKDYNTKYFNLDVIISVGYRVKSRRGTQFRIWANKVLKDFLLKGFALNKKLLQNQNEKLNQLNETIKLISSISASEYLNAENKDTILLLLERYSKALNILDDYDYNKFSEIQENEGTVYILKYDEVRKIINKMKSTVNNSKHFGKEKDESLKSSISAIYQTFDGKDLYPTIIEKAVILLYFIVKNHSFVDGNKRIAASVFLYFLAQNKILAQIELDNDLLVALTLMIANSKPSDKDLIVNIVSVILQVKN